MKILSVGDSEANYLAKYHEAFRTGLRRMYNCRMFGKDYPGHEPSLDNYQDIISYSCPDGPPDLLLVACDHDSSIRQKGVVPYNFKLKGLEKINIPKCMVLSDFWNITEYCQQEYLQWLDYYGITKVLVYYPHMRDLYYTGRDADRFEYLPPCFDPELFNSWSCEKEFDVGFLGGGVADRDDFYPERYAIHSRLKSLPGISYLFKPHPGWGNHDAGHSYVGLGFSRTINSCRLFVTTGGMYNCPYPKYVEILASKSCLLAIEPLGHQALGLVDGVNYVKITPDDVLDKVNFYLAHPDKAEQIAEAGYQTAMQLHTSYARALDFQKVANRIVGES